MRKRQGLRAQMRTYNAISREMQANAKRGAEQSEIVTMGRRFKTYVFRTDAQANAWMAENARWGCIAVYPGSIHVAHMDDKGTPA